MVTKVAASGSSFVYAIYLIDAIYLMDSDGGNVN